MIANKLKTLFRRSHKNTGQTAPDPRTRIHFLHIGKCAGNQVGHVAEFINSVSTDRKIIKHGHDVFLRNLPEEEPYFFSIRSPISRFYSGFYSRKRMGMPLIHSKWTACEKFAFDHFPEANDLAEALFSDGDLGYEAVGAMNSIRHTSQNQIGWFYCAGAFLVTRPPIYILRQENFEADLNKFPILANLQTSASQVPISTDKVTAHANDYSKTPPLSQKAKDNLKRWYVQDLAFYDMCSAWLDACEAPPRTSGL